MDSASHNNSTIPKTESRPVTTEEEPLVGTSSKFGQQLQLQKASNRQSPRRSLHTNFWQLASPKDLQGFESNDWQYPVIDLKPNEHTRSNHTESEIRNPHVFPNSEAEGNATVQQDGENVQKEVKSLWSPPKEIEKQLERLKSGSTSDLKGTKSENTSAIHRRGTPRRRNKRFKIMFDSKEEPQNTKHAAITHTPGRFTLPFDLPVVDQEFLVMSLYNRPHTPTRTSQNANSRVAQQLHHVFRNAPRGRRRPNLFNYGTLIENPPAPAARPVEERPRNATDTACSPCGSAVQSCQRACSPVSSSLLKPSCTDKQTIALVKPPPPIKSKRMKSTGTNRPRLSLRNRRLRKFRLSSSPKTPDLQDSTEKLDHNHWFPANKRRFDFDSAINSPQSPFPGFYLPPAPRPELFDVYGFHSHRNYYTQVKPAGPSKQALPTSTRRVSKAASVRSSKGNVKRHLSAGRFPPKPGQGVSFHNQIASRHSVSSQGGRHDLHHHYQDRKSIHHLVGHRQTMHQFYQPNQMHHPADPHHHTQHHIEAGHHMGHPHLTTSHPENPHYTQPSHQENYHHPHPTHPEHYQHPHPIHTDHYSHPTHPDHHPHPTHPDHHLHPGHPDYHHPHPGHPDHHNPQPGHPENSHYHHPSHQESYHHHHDGSYQAHHPHDGSYQAHPHHDGSYQAHHHHDGSYQAHHHHDGSYQSLQHHDGSYQSHHDPHHHHHHHHPEYGYYGPPPPPPYPPYYPPPPVFSDQVFDTATCKPAARTLNTPAALGPSYQIDDAASKKSSPAATSSAQSSSTSSSSDSLVDTKKNKKNLKVFPPIEKHKKKAKKLTEQEDLPESVASGKVSGESESKKSDGTSEGSGKTEGALSKISGKRDLSQTDEIGLQIGREDSVSEGSNTLASMGDPKSPLFKPYNSKTGLFYRFPRRKYRRSRRRRRTRSKSCKCRDKDEEEEPAAANDKDQCQYSCPLSCPSYTFGYNPAAYYGHCGSYPGAVQSAYTLPSNQYPYGSNPYMGAYPMMPTAYSNPYAPAPCGSQPFFPSSQTSPTQPRKPSKCASPPPAPASFSGPPQYLCQPSRQEQKSPWSRNVSPAKEMSQYPFYGMNPYMPSYETAGFGGSPTGMEGYAGYPGCGFPYCCPMILYCCPPPPAPEPKKEAKCKKKKCKKQAFQLPPAMTSFPEKSRPCVAESPPKCCCVDDSICCEGVCHNNVCCFEDFKCEIQNF